MMDYQTAVRGAFLISPASPRAPTISPATRYLMMACCLSSRENSGAAAVAGGRTVSASAKGYLDLRGQLLLPGFVDAHVHYPQTEMIGAFGEQLLEWLTTYTFPVESQFADEEYAQRSRSFCQPAAEPRHHHRAGVLYPASRIGRCAV
jgi:guanine deaminase